MADDNWNLDLKFMRLIDTNKENPVKVNVSEIELLYTKILEDLYDLQKEDIKRKGLSYRGIYNGITPNLAIQMTTDELFHRFNEIINRRFGL